MNKREEYLKLLGIEVSNFTMDELNKAYRKQMHKYHPDHIKESGLSYEEANKKAKRINEAYTELKKYLKGGNVNFSNSKSSNKSNRASSNFNSRQYIANILNIIKNNYLNFDYDQENNLDIHLDFSILDSIIFRMVTKTSKESIDYVFNEFKTEYKKFLKQAKEKFFRTHFIDESNIKSINYDLPLKEFLEQLEQFKIKYSISNKYGLELNNAVSEFEGYAYYNELKNIIEEFKNKYFEEKKKDKFISFNIEEFKVEVQKIFADYDLFNKRVNELLKKCNEFGNDIDENAEVIRLIDRDVTHLIDRILRIKKNYNGIDDLKFLDSIEKELIEIKEARNRKATINKLHLEILKKMKEFLKKDPTNKENIDRFNAIYKIIYESVLAGKISLEDYCKLKDLSFTDFQKDMDLITEIITSIDEFKVIIPDSKSIEVNNNLRIKMISPNRKVLTKENPNLTTITDMTWREVKQYRTLEVIRKNNAYDGTIMEDLREHKKYMILYKLDDSNYALVLNESGIVLVKDISICRECEDSSFPYDKEEFRDINSLKKLIVSDILGSTSIAEEFINDYKDVINKIVNKEFMFDKIKNIKDEIPKNNDDIIKIYKKENIFW